MKGVVENPRTGVITLRLTRNTRNIATTGSFHSLGEQGIEVREGMREWFEIVSVDNTINALHQLGSGDTVTAVWNMDNAKSAYRSYAIPTPPAQPVLQKPDPNGLALILHERKGDQFQITTIDGSTICGTLRSVMEVPGGVLVVLEEAPSKVKDVNGQDQMTVGSIAHIIAPGETFRLLASRRQEEAPPG